MLIIGAGLAGLIAGNIFQRATLIERGPEDQLTHRAVLRFRSRAVSDAVGIDFREVTVHKGIWHNGAFCSPNIRLANMYSRKVALRWADRSIWNLDPAQRFIAPENFAQQLAERCHGRIEWNEEVSAEQLFALKSSAISTMPMPVLANLLSIDTSAVQFSNYPIRVQRWRIPRCDVFQTVYFPGEETPLYRASITGDLLIAESIESADQQVDSVLLEEVFAVSGLRRIDNVKQSYGKITTIDDAWRKQFLFRATHDFGIFSLGRFATWRNILLDDVVHDVAVIKRLLGAGVYALARSL